MAENKSRFAGKVAFVTGAGSGIGRATALAFAQEGAKVALVDISDKGMKETADQIAALGGVSVSIRCDVTKGDEVKAAIDQTVATLGGLDAAFNNAGIEQPTTNLADIDDALFDRVIAVNLKSVFLCMKHEIDHMLKSGGGTIVNTSSGAGVLAIRGQSSYCAAKFGVVAMTKTAALETAAHQIRVNAVCPGITDTPMIARYTGGTEEGRARIIKQEPVGRMARADEIAEAVLWLASGDSDFVTGHAMVVDGGQTAGI